MKPLQTGSLNSKKQERLLPNEFKQTKKETLIRKKWVIEREQAHTEKKKLKQKREKI